MNDASIFEESRSGDFRDMQRVEATCRRWERDIPYIKRAAYGRYAPTFCFGRPGINIDIRYFSGNSDDFYTLIDTALMKRFYQPETRRKYLSVLKHFLKWLTVPVNRVTDKCIYAYLCSLFNNRMKPATYSLYLSALRTIFDCFCNLEITHGMTLPKIEKGEEPSRRSAAVPGRDGQAGTHVLQRREATEDGRVTKEDVDVVLQWRHSARDLALFMGLLFLDVKLNELLNIRRKDVVLDTKTIIAWGGPGREERKIEMPKVLIPFFIARMNEVSDGDYLFSSDRNVQKSVTGQGANKIIQRMFLNAGLNNKVNCRMMRQSGIEANDILSADIAERFFKSEMLLLTRHKQPVESVGKLKIEVGELVRYKGIISADIEFSIRGLVGEDIKFRGVRISTLSYKGPSISFPSNEKWEKELLWVSREMKERICNVEFKDKISGIITEKYLEKKKTCYIRRERVNDYWKKTG